MKVQWLFFKIWNALSGEELKSLPHGHIVKTVDFSSDGKNLITGSNDKLLRIFDLEKIDSGKNAFKEF